MSKRSTRKRRHIVEAARAADRAANRAAMQECVQQMAQSLRREIDTKLLHLGQMAAQVLPKTRPLGLLRGTIPPGQSPKLEPGEFFGE